MPASSDRPDLPLSSQAREPGGRGDEGAAWEDGGVVLVATLPAVLALHACGAADLVRAASKLQAKVTVSANGKRANARSILDALALGATGGTELTVSATGPYADDAARTIAEIVARLGT